MCLGEICQTSEPKVTVSNPSRCQVKFSLLAQYGFVHLE